MHGSYHVAFNQWQPGAPDWGSTRIDFDFQQK
jgi:hypothetical protein